MVLINQGLYLYRYESYLQIVGIYVCICKSSPYVFKMQVLFYRSLCIVLLALTFIGTE